ncbi:hypothetical protein PIROE2DRAFT_5444 [Piromyces sp. E2]|nr:hypothetical protein PIROE2DRAFT_5444 [Piromyces sp. E2]|eukprot:OUM67176.1 hypothetical protein PIROE2DRAFT_5444 [Piromyces sp. E2]
MILKFYYDGQNNYKSNKSYQPIVKKNEKRSDFDADSYLQEFENDNSNDGMNYNIDKRDKTFDNEFYENATQSTFKNSRLIAKELIHMKIDGRSKVCVKQFIPSPRENYELYNTAEIEPDTLDMIKKHIIQLSDIVNDYKDLIYIHEGAFVGLYGDMKFSKYSDNDSLSKIVDTIDEHFDSSIFLSVRTPIIYRKLENTFKMGGAFNSTSFSSRMGLYNNGLFNGENDCGTYSKNMRESEISFQNRLCLNVPNGGEGVYYSGSNRDQAKYNEFKYADEYARSIHLSYLNGEYDFKLLKIWDQTTGNEIRNRYPGWNTNGRECIGRHLGYRYIIENSKIVNDRYLNIMIKNVGYSPSYKNFDVKLYLVERNNQRQVIPCQVSNDDTRKWENDKSITLKFDLNSIKKQYSYTLLLTLLRNTK